MKLFIESPAFSICHIYIVILGMIEKIFLNNQYINVFIQTLKGLACTYVPDRAAYVKRGEGSPQYTGYIGRHGI